LTLLQARFSMVNLHEITGTVPDQKDVFLAVQQTTPPRSNLFWQERRSSHPSVKNPATGQESISTY
jgi:hypothetical protein